MAPVDLKELPTNLPSQPSGLALADIYRYVAPCDRRFKVPDVVSTDRPLTTQERAVIIKLAFYVARQRGADTIGSLTLDEMLKAGDKTICPLTLEVTSSKLERAYLRSHCDHCCVEAAPMDFVGQMLGWSPFDLWGREREKQKLSNFVPITEWVAKTMQYASHAAFVPTPSQLSKLIVELEARLAAAISSREAWTMSTDFGASTAVTSIEVEADSSRNRAPFVAHAHEYDYIAFPFSCSGPRELVMHNDGAPVGAKETKHLGTSCYGDLAEFEPPIPSFASFISSAAAVATYVFRINRAKVEAEEEGEEEEWEWRDQAQENHYNMCVYMCKLMMDVVSGNSFAATLATRPQDDHLPKLTSQVESCARDHAEDDECKRIFPAFDKSQPAERKRKRPQREREEDELPHPGELRVYEVNRVSRGPEGSSVSYGDDACYSWRVARQGSKAHRECDEEVFRSAFWKYETAYNQHTRALIKAFDGGRGRASLFDIVTGGWDAFYQGLGVEKAEELEGLRARLLKTAEDLLEWLTKVVEHRRRDAA